MCPHGWTSKKMNLGGLTREEITARIEGLQVQFDRLKTEWEAKGKTGETQQMAAVRGQLQRLRRELDSRGTSGS